MDPREQPDADPAHWEASWPPVGYVVGNDAAAGVGGGERSGEQVGVLWAPPGARCSGSHPLRRTFIAGDVLAPPAEPRVATRRQGPA